MKKGDIVTVQCERPEGPLNNPVVKGRVGVIIDVEELEDERVLTVKDEKGEEWSYWEEELKYADVKEISEALVRMIERR